MLTTLLFVMAVEAVAVEVLLRGLEAPRGVRVLVVAVDLYSVLIGLAIFAACVTRPHVVSPGELRVRYGAFFDLRVPRELISSVRPARNDNESGTVTVRNGRLSVAVSSRTNVVVELREPVPVVRPLGRRAETTVICFFADVPGTALAALSPLCDGVPHNGGSPRGPLPAGGRARPGRRGNENGTLLHRFQGAQRPPARDRGEEGLEAVGVRPVRR